MELPSFILLSDPIPMAVSPELAVRAVSAKIVPATCSFCEGEVVPIPTRLLVSNVITSVVPFFMCILVELPVIAKVRAVPKFRRKSSLIREALDILSKCERNASPVAWKVPPTVRVLDRLATLIPTLPVSSITIR